MTQAMPNNSVERDGHKLRLRFPPPLALALTSNVERLLSEPANLRFGSGVRIRGSLKRTFGLLIRDRPVRSP